VVGAFFAVSVMRNRLLLFGRDVIRPQQNPLMTAINLAYGAFALALFFDLGFRKGTAGPNRYGRDPLAKS